MSRLLILQHLERERPGLFIKIAEERAFSIFTFRVDLGDILPKFRKGDLLLVLGGPMGIRDIGTTSYPWLIEEVALIKEALHQGIAIIGVCLGAQLLAYAAGGDVEVLQEGVSHKPLAEIGWDNVFTKSLENNCKLKTFLSKPLSVLHWHGDRILLPTKAELIASSRRCKEQLFRIGSFAYGIQFHVEIDDEMVNTWIKEDKTFISSSLVVDGQSILKQQQKEFGQKTLNSRLEFLNILFDLLN